ncbi:replication initiation protein [Roseibium sp. RKSG952]|uniref:replication initiation protein n=1 Tax=Roseibium sp. RKSG952 TaxID=2529384 RepID=UPI001FCBAA6A|nr:replication initiation protein [Roseibium sp. RKSG952]
MLYELPVNFTKIEAHAAHRLTGHGRQLYAILADKKRLGRPYWIFTLEEIRALMGVGAHKSYDRWNNFRARVLDPAIAAINDYGTVSVQMTPEKRGRSVYAVRFDWEWKDPYSVTQTAQENDRHSRARRKKQVSDDAPPMIEDKLETTLVIDWWNALTEEERNFWADKVGQILTVGTKNYTRPEREIARIAYKKATQPNN